MIEITVKLDYQGKCYQTNVIARRGTAQEEIYQTAMEQIQKQVAN
ncbi:BA3454 family stress response protein [Peribacillus sp. B-H-3]